MIYESIAKGGYSPYAEKIEKKDSLGRRIAIGGLVLLTGLSISCTTPTYKTQEPVSRTGTYIQKEEIPFIKYVIGAVVSIGVSLGASYLVHQALPDKPVHATGNVIHTANTPESVPDEPWHGGGHGD